MLLVFDIVFSVPVISLVTSIGGGRVERGWSGWWGWVGSQRQIKAPI